MKKETIINPDSYDVKVLRERCRYLEKELVNTTVLWESSFKELEKLRLEHDSLKSQYKSLVQRTLGAEPAAQGRQILELRVENGMEPYKQIK